ncbi:MAG: hypothetical protein JWP85_1453 [Rhodoglobus sp.]|nr:hypothetical protein [Rhodoglobus sp.]
MEERPTWQVDPCPEWCAGAHTENDHVDDRVHRSEGIAVPAVIRSKRLGSTRVEFDEEAGDVEVGISRTDGQRETWLYVGSGPGREIELSLDTASRVLRTARHEVKRARG